MKILRIRRGFTTNSSASSEWVPPQWTPGSKVPPAPGSAPSVSGASPSGTPPTSVTPVATEPMPAPVQPVSNLPTNAWAVGGVLGLVALVVAIERTMRRVLGPRKLSEGEDD